MLFVVTEPGGKIIRRLPGQRNQFFFDAFIGKTHGRTRNADRPNDAPRIIANRAGDATHAVIQFFIINGIALLGNLA